MGRTFTTPMLRLARVLLCFGFVLMEFTGVAVPSLDRATLSPSVRHALAQKLQLGDEGGGINWPRGQALPSFASPQLLDVAEVNDLPGDLCLMLATLQGLVNRSRPQIYLMEGLPAEGVATWLYNLSVPYRLHSDPWEVVDKYLYAARGVIVYDPKIMNSVNVATTMAGLDDGLVVSPALLTRLTADPYNLPVLADLRGKFSSNLEANIWQVQHLWPRASHRLLVGLLPTTPSKLVGRVTTYGYLRDYAVANRAMVFWYSLLNPVEVNLFKRVLSGVEPGTPYMGWYDKEFRGVRLTSSYGVYTLAADYFSNLTVFSGVKAPTFVQQSVPAPALKKKIYVTLTMSEGDNLQYTQHTMRKLWEDPQRGHVPLNWSLNPVLIDAAPSILNHYQLTATANDDLIASPSGSGYCYPSSWSPGNLNSFLQRSNTYLNRTGMHVIFILDNQSMLSNAIAQAYSKQLNASGILLNWWNELSRTSISSGNLPVSTQVTAVERVQMLRAIRQSAAHWNRSSPLFISALAISWNLTPTDMKYVADHLGSDYTVVRGDQYFELIRKARKLPASRY
ncbi:hypothetical protein KDA_46110 [Dictyobacter alpinus]|uniref:GxGYxYP putative glycoside hydrolase N-terminal domain-containing protein n=1 Tax=Dictyobacter alpinus TaxID=2014873 RepID=A0A402BCW8_9CHLR|nr:GxGYxYP domain-containing protein [Dictyobacter alpinus]GCE29127.1 hypothetical protein KDA_46110 [Dictyobacter alpinus]